MLEPGTGRLLKIYTDYNEDDPSVPAEWPAKQMEREKRSINVVYAGLVDTVPPVSFHEALEESIFTQPLSAKQILAWLVMYSRQGEEASPHWVILGRGVPPIGLPSAPDRFTNPNQDRLSGNRFECVIDAISGKGIGCGESGIYLRND